MSKKEQALPQAGMELRPEDERAIVALIYTAARCADERRYTEWIDLFTDDGEYSAITHENSIGTGLHLYKDRGKRALQERAAYHIGIWQVPRGKTLHVVGNVVVTVGETGDLANAVSNFIMTRTGDMQHAKLHACGQYRDTFCRRGNGWLFRSRQVVVDSNLLPGEFTDLL